MDQGGLDGTYFVVTHLLMQFAVYLIPMLAVVVFSLSTALYLRKTMREQAKSLDAIKTDLGNIKAILGSRNS